MDESHSVMSDSLHSQGLYSPTGSSVHGIFQARVQEWGATAFSIPSFSSVQSLSRVQLLATP